MSSRTPEFRIEFAAGAADFLELAGGLLAADPINASVVATIAHRESITPPLSGERPFDWWAVVRDRNGEPAGAAMRTAPFAPYPVYLLPMPQAAAIGLARVLVERGEWVGGANGALPATRTFAEEAARLQHGSVRLLEETRLHELRSLIPPPLPRLGRVRPAVAAEAELMVAWFEAFGVEAAEQAGRPQPHPGPETGRETMLRRISAGEIWVWADENDRPVHVTGFNRSGIGMARIGPVFTPREHRGRGHAAAVVAEVGRRLLGEGLRVCLFTDTANPTSNALYARIGFVPVSEQEHVAIELPS